MKKYLTDKNRVFYTQAFLHAKNCKDEFWGLDQGLVPHLERINKNPNIRALYSKKGPSNKNYRIESYLEFCYTKKVENKIEESFKNLDFANLTLDKQKPKKQDKPTGKKHPCLKYVKDPEYWNVWHYRATIDGGIENEHQDFWIGLADILEKIGL